MEKSKSCTADEKGKITRRSISIQTTMPIGLNWKATEKKLNNTVGKFLTSNEGFTDSQYSFWKFRGTIHAINLLKTIVSTAKKKRKIDVLTIHVKNAFNSVPWVKILEAACHKGLPHYIHQMLDSYFNDRILLYHLDGTGI